MEFEWKERSQKSSSSTKKFVYFFKAGGVDLRHGPYTTAGPWYYIHFGTEIFWWFIDLHVWRVLLSQTHNILSCLTWIWYMMPDVHYHWYVVLCMYSVTRNTIFFYCLFFPFSLFVRFKLDVTVERLIYSVCFIRCCLFDINRWVTFFSFFLFSVFVVDTQHNRSENETNLKFPLQIEIPSRLAMKMSG